MTYQICIRIIDIAKKRGQATEAWASDMKTKLDVFLLAGRIDDKEYRELLEMITSFT